MSFGIDACLTIHRAKKRVGGKSHLGISTFVLCCCGGWPIQATLCADRNILIAALGWRILFVVVLLLSGSGLSGEQKVITLCPSVSITFLRWGTRRGKKLAYQLIMKVVRQRKEYIDYAALMAVQNMSKREECA